MGLFDKFKDYQQSRTDKRIEKNLKTIKNSKAIREDRAAALEFFRTHDDPEVAVPALLQRFEYSLEHGINDTREKEGAMEGIVRFGEKALPHVREHLFNTTRIAWPIKVLNALGREEVVVDTLKSALDYGDVAFDQAKVDKNYDILCYLRDYQLGPDFVEKAKHFLDDPDERVRFAVVELLIEQDVPGVAELLEVYLADESAENRRIRQSVMEAFFNKQWTLRNPTRFADGRVAGPVFVSNRNTLEVRQ